MHLRGERERGGAPCNPRASGKEVHNYQRSNGKAGETHQKRKVLTEETDLPKRPSPLIAALGKYDAIHKGSSEKRGPIYDSQTQRG